MKMKKTRQETILSDVEIVDAGAEGKAIARVDGMVIFVPFVVPGDIVDIKIFKKKKNYAEGRAIALKQPSPLRREAACPHFGICGGCKWQTLDYTAQLQYKQQQVKDNLERLGHLDTSTMKPICGSEQVYYYRNKLEFTFSSKRWLKEGEIRSDDDPGALGFHIPTLFDKVLPIEHCALQSDPSNAIRNSIGQYAIEHQLPFYDIRNHNGYLRNIVIRNSSIGEWMVTIIVAEDKPEWLNPLLEFVHKQFRQITALLYIINNKFNDSYTDLEAHTYYGKDHIMEAMPRYNGGTPLHFKIGPKSFYQTNSQQAFRLYSFVADYAHLTGNEIVYDLYTGTGTIAQFLASNCKKVIGVEYVEDAISDARINAAVNGFDNCTFYAGDMAQVLTDDFIAANGNPDVVVTDPPRAGMHEKVVSQLLRMKAPRIVYVSCNPATQARDIAMLMEAYTIAAIQPVDMFPHTQHVENVCLLIRKDK